MVMTDHDDNNQAKAERLVRRALAQAGVPDGLARFANLEWRHVGFRAGVEISTRYAVPPRFDRRARHHARVRRLDSRGVPVAVGGPPAIGAGRYASLGLLAAHRRAGAAE